MKQNDFIKKGESIYQKIQSDLLKKYQPHQSIVIEVKSGKYFVGDDDIEAMEKAKKAFPHSHFFGAQIGELHPPLFRSI